MNKERRKKQRLEIDEEEEEEEKDDEDQDPDYNPDKDPENDFIDDESIFTEDQDVMEIEKHSHAINFKESGEYTVWIRDNLDELERAVKVGGCSRMFICQIHRTIEGWHHEDGNVLPNRRIRCETGDENYCRPDLLCMAKEDEGS